MDLNTFIPKYIKQTEVKRTREVITNDRWNELWNLIITQGDYNSETLEAVVTTLATKLSTTTLSASGGSNMVGSPAIPALGQSIDSTVYAQLFLAASMIADRYTKAQVDGLLATDADKYIANVVLNANKDLVITWGDGDSQIIQLDLEKIPASFSFDQTGTKLVITNQDGSKYETDITSLINLYTFNDSATIDFTQTGYNVSATIKAGSITDTMLQSGLMNQLQAFVTYAEGSASTASIAKYDAEEARDLAVAAKTDAQTSANTATTKAGEASASASSAATSATDANTAKTGALSANATANLNMHLAQSYAVGGSGFRAGEDTDNSKYYCQQAAEIASGAGTMVKPVYDPQGKNQDIFAYTDNAVSNSIKNGEAMAMVSMVLYEINEYSSAPTPSALQYLNTVNGKIYVYNASNLSWEDDTADSLVLYGTIIVGLTTKKTYVYDETNAKYSESNVLIFEDTIVQNCIIATLKYDAETGQAATLYKYNGSALTQFLLPNLTPLIVFYEFTHSDDPNAKLRMFVEIAEGMYILGAPTWGFDSVSDEEGNTVDMVVNTLTGNINTVSTSIANFIATKGVANGICDLDATGNVPFSRLGNVVSGAPYLTQDLNLYVATTGNDTTGDGSSGNPYATWGKALSVVPKNLNGHTVDITISAGTYTEIVNINNFYNGSKNSDTSTACDIQITITGIVYIRQLKISNCRVYWFATAGGYELRRIGSETTGTFIIVSGGGWLLVSSNSPINPGASTASNCLAVNLNSFAQIGSIYVHNAVVGMTPVTIYGSLVISSFIDISLTGAGSIGLLASGGDIKVGSVSTLTAATRFTKQGGGTIKTGAGVDLT